MLKLLPIPLCCLALSACGEPQRHEPMPPIMDYRKAATVAEVEAMIPKNVAIPYQQLFGCTFDTATKEGKPLPAIDPVFVGRILETVRNDHEAGMKCLTKLRKK